MKRVISFFVVTVMLLCLCACGSDGKAEEKDTTTNSLENAIEEAKQFAKDKSSESIKVFYNIVPDYFDNTFVVYLRDKNDPTILKDPEASQEEKLELTQQSAFETKEFDGEGQSDIADLFNGIAGIFEDYPDMKLGIMHFSYYDMLTWSYSFDGLSWHEMTEEEIQQIVENHIEEVGEERFLKEINADSIKNIKLGSVNTISEGSILTSSKVACYGTFSSYDKFGDYVADYKFTWEMWVDPDGYISEETTLEVEER